MGRSQDMAVPWIWSLFSLPFIGVILKGIFDLVTGRTAERRQLRREGSSVVTPAKELVNTVGPEALIWGSDEQLNEYLNECHQKWWKELRGPLMVYVNQHPSARVRQLGEEFATSVAVAISATRYLLMTRKTTTTMEEFEDSDRKKKESLALADDLFAEVRRRWPRWLRLPKLPWP